MAVASLPETYLDLPTPLTSLVGRERDVATVSALIADAKVRLVTLTGPGGIGKTRLALAVAGQMETAFADGIVFVPLATVRDDALVLPTIAQALGIRSGGDRPVLSRLATALRGRELLLVLDNLEQVIPAGADLAALLTAVPSLTVLATSRTVLGVSGEYDVQVAPLELAPTGHALTLAELAATEAIALFVERARAANSGFTLTEANAATVAAICERLDGLPLAIELAAGRCRILSPSALLARLSDRFRLLSGGPRDQPPRLRSMRDAIAWSYDLLSPTEQSLFRSLSVFAGGCTLEAAEALGNDSNADVLETMTALVQHSLLHRIDPPGMAPRFGMLETVREYALEQLIEHGEEPDARARHAEYYAALASRQEVTWWLPPELALEHANVRGALAWAIEHGVERLTIPLGIGLWEFLDPSSDYELIRAAVDSAATVPPELGDAWSLLLAATCQYAFWSGDHARAAILLDQCAALLGVGGNTAAVALATLCLGYLTLGIGNAERSEGLATEALRRWQDLGDQRWVGEALCLLGRIARLSDLDRAEMLLSESLAISRTYGPPTACSNVLNALAATVLERGDHRQALALTVESLIQPPMEMSEKDPTNLESSLALLIAVTARIGRAELAVRLFGADTSLCERRGLGAFTDEVQWRDQAVAPARKRLSATAFAKALAIGRSQPLAEVVSEAMTMAADVLKPTSLPHRHDHALTFRELEVLSLLVEGQTNQQIAATLFISPRTARAHVAAILAKLEVSTRSAAVSHALRHNLV